MKNYKEIEKANEEAINDMYFSLTKGLLEYIASTPDQMVEKPEWYSLGTSINGFNGTIYTGLNQANLFITRLNHPHFTQRWITMGDLKKNKIWVKKGEKSSRIIAPHLDKLDKRTKERLEKMLESNDEEIKEEAIQEIKKSKEVIRFRKYPVFNESQLMLTKEQRQLLFPLDSKLHKENLKSFNSNIFDKMEKYIENPVCKITEKQFSILDVPHFNAKNDEIIVPLRNSFINLGSFYSTVLHESFHATGTENRLDREYLKNYSSDLNNRAKEEFVAEFGSLLTLAGSDYKKEIDRSNDYLKSWAKALKDKPEEVLKEIKEHIIDAKKFIELSTNEQRENLLKSVKDRKDKQEVKIESFNDIEVNLNLKKKDKSFGRNL